jgi:hypothetical protein
VLLLLLVQVQPDIVIHSSIHDPAILGYVQEGKRIVEKFFGGPFKEQIKLEVFSDRSQLDDAFAKRWKAPKTEKWMVASAVADTFYLLSPTVWKTQAVEHDPGDKDHVQRIITHELVHMYHAQHNKDREMEKVDGIGWFVEGLATYASGQMEHEQKGKLLERPSSLSTAWSGKNRYALSGSLVAYIDHSYGRKTLIALLPAQTEAQILKRLRVSATTFLENWWFSFR